MKLAKWRIETDISQKQVARLLEDALGRTVYQGTISKLESGGYTPSLVWVLAIKKITDGKVTENDWGVKPPRKRAS